MAKSHSIAEAHDTIVSTSFPESQFAISRHGSTEYWQCVSRGHTRMKTGRVVLCGLARDIAHILPTTIARLERLGELFADYRVVIYENDSTDATPQILDAWRGENPRVTILSETLGEPVNPGTRCLERAARMAFYRNQVQRHIADHLADFDHVVVIDTDLPGGWSWDGVAHSFGQDDWDFIGSYGILLRRVGFDPNVRFHFDAWAYRAAGSDQPIPTKQVNRLVWHRGDAMVHVNSCFGGLGMYRMEAYLASAYEGSDCEHVTFHRDMRAAGFDRLYLNPSQITLYGRRRSKLDPLVIPLSRILPTHRRAA